MPAGNGAHKVSTKFVKTSREVARRVLGGVEAQGEQPSGSHFRTDRWYWAKSTSSITAGTFEFPTTFTFNVWLPDPADTSSNPPLIVATESTLLGVTGSNYMSVVASSGTRLKVEFAFGVWNLKIADCS